MDTPARWLQVSRSAEEAAMMLIDAHPRSAVSRFYYAAYAAVHATMISKGQGVPQRGNWAHEGLGENLEAVLTRKDAGVKPRDASLYANRLGQLYDLRIEADYGVQRVVDAAAARKSRQLAGPLIRLAERMIKE